MVTLNSFLILGALMFAIGLFGALSKRNSVAILMSIEIMLNAVNITISPRLGVYRQVDAAGVAVGSRLTGQIFAISHHRKAAERRSRWRSSSVSWRSARWTWATST
jgi:NADH:ubiquinone oxidoreductase subunit K